MTDPIIQTKTCQHCSTNFDITQGDIDFYRKISPTFAGSLFLIPCPSLCPDCRQRRRLSFRNERKLYKRKCDASGKDIISIYHPNSELKVFDQKVWRSDDRDPVDYGFEFDFTRTFTEQFWELMTTVPRVSLGIYNSENCDYTNEIIDCKSCYLIFSGVENDSCLYSHYIDYSNHCVDCDQTTRSENCYNCFSVESCFNCKLSNHCKNCISVYNCSYCDGCKNCYNCVGLINQEYCVNNIQYTKEEYENMVFEPAKKQPDKKGKINTNSNMNWIINSENCTGAYILNSKNILISKNIQNSEDCKWCMRGAGMQSCYDCFITGVIPNSLYIECMTVGPGTKNGFCTNSWPNVNYIYYCDSCSNSSNLFGCIGLRNQQYCIFNRQYTKEEYELQVEKIIQHMMTTGEWGEFFHPSLSPFGYNETVAQKYYPVTLTDDGQMMDQKIYSEDVNSSDKSSAISSANLQIYGYQRSTYEAPTPIVDNTINGANLPDTINEISDDILKTAIICETSGKPFRIIPQELAFYRKHNISLPRKHPDVRHLERMKLRK